MTLREKVSSGETLAVEFAFAGLAKAAPGRRQESTCRPSASAGKAEGGLVKAKPNQYRTVDALKNDLTPREGRARLLASAKTSVA